MSDNLITSNDPEKMENTVCSDNNGTNEPVFSRRKELEVRCNVCGKRFFDLVIMIETKEPNLLLDENKFLNGLQNCGFHVKIGTEVWCRQCKGMDFKIIIPELA